MENLQKIKRALISVSDKTGLIDFAKTLIDFDVEIISTGGTAKTLREATIKVTEVAEITGFPEMMDGRVKTLHPKIHGAFLALRDNLEHLSAMEKHGIVPIDLVVVNLYPFEETVEREDVTLPEVVEQIDIGGPAMIRSAAKNWQSVAVVTAPELYEEISAELKNFDGALSMATRQTLATLAYTHTGRYDMIISSYLAENLSAEGMQLFVSHNPFSQDFEELRDANFEDAFFNQSGISQENIATFMNGNPLAEIKELGQDFQDEDEENALSSEKYIDLIKITDLRYGENPHQKAALYDNFEAGGIANAVQMHGKEMSYNNYLDADAAWRLVCDFDELVCAIIKHTNPSGVGLGETCEEAYQRALATDPVSAFGGIVAFNRKIDAQVAKSISEIFTEVIVAPEIDEDALEVFKAKKNLRVLLAKPIENENFIEYRTITGGVLAQNTDCFRLMPDELKFVSQRQPTEKEIESLIFAWRVCKHVKSNAIVLTNDVQTLGVGAGQMNRVDSVRIASIRAERFGFDLKNSVLASDAFFPFRDNIDEAAKFGISAIIQPGGSVRDEEVIQACNEHGLAMVFSGIRHFKH